ncbi:MAG: hypothetical protein ACOCX0_02770 [Bacteroidota bacterium]
MKRHITFLVAVSLALLLIPACDQAYRADTTNLEDIRKDCREVIQMIDETLYQEDVDQFKKNMRDVLGRLNQMLDAYLDEMDNTGQQLDKNARDLVIELKEKRVETAFKLALLETVDPVRDAGSRGNGNTNAAAERFSQNDTAFVRTPSQGGQYEETTTEIQIRHGQELMVDMREDLRYMKIRLEEFLQAILYDVGSREH